MSSSRDRSADSPRLGHRKLGLARGVCCVCHSEVALRKNRFDADASHAPIVGTAGFQRT